MESTKTSCMAKPVRTSGSQGDNEHRERRLTVARIRQRGDHEEVLFYESARFYRLPHTTPNFASTIEALRAAVGKSTPMNIRFSEPNSDVIESVLADK